jgi:hypothetical protein
MSADLETSLSAMSLSSASPGRQKRFPVLKYIIAVAAPVSLLSSGFLMFLRWNLSDWLEGFGIVCLLATLMFLIISLFRRKWKDAGIFAAVWLIVLFPPSGSDMQESWLAVQGFRIHASPVENYLSKCKLIRFEENGAKQTVGECEYHGEDDLTVFYRVIYDTTGNLLKPSSQQSPPWKRAMDAFFGPGVLATSRERTQHIWGDFYLVSTTGDEERG